MVKTAVSGVKLGFGELLSFLISGEGGGVIKILFTFCNLLKKVYFPSFH